jgi:serine/threonine protein kinase/tetratricopeptide (TPR) repeat protein
MLMTLLEHHPLIAGLYRLTNVIGSGGMGSVYKAYDIRTQQLVAIKQLKQAAINDDPEVIERFKREGEALRQLNHPNIVKVLDTIREDDQHYLIMEYVNGGSLADLLKKQSSMTIEQVVKTGIEIADALTRTHYLKIIHRDLKPANVLLTENGAVCLTDFGIAHVSNAEQLTEAGRLIGTPAYLAPEVINGATASASGDIWAFGIMLFEMLSGQRPFVGETLSQLVASILTQPLPDLESLRPDAPITLVDLVYRMLEKDPQQRIRSVRIVGAEFEAISQVLERPEKLPIRNHSKLLVTESSSARRHNLPAQTTGFVGREEELIRLSHVLDRADVRLITLLAPGGMGKTRLAIEIAHAHLDSFIDGVFFVPLAPVSTPQGIVTAIIDALKFSFSGDIDPKQQLVQILSTKYLLLILDNFEHLLSDVSLVVDILEAAPAIKIMATSRSKLNLQGETLFTMDGMKMPETEKLEDVLQTSAAQLFMQTAQRIHPGFTLTAHDAPYLSRICQQVEGLPLGILLAAAWVDTLSLPEITSEISKSFDFLETEQQNIPTRQRSIRAVFDYSWNLLSADERNVFMKLSVFSGDFTRDAAEKVVGATLKSLAALSSKSMLRRNVENGRYSIHELLRQYSARKLVEANREDEARKAHSEYFAEYVERCWRHMQEGSQIAALRQMDSEYNNIRTAWLYLVDHRRTSGLAAFAYALWMYFELRSRHQDGQVLFGHAVRTLRAFPQIDELRFLIGCMVGMEAYHFAGVGASDISEPRAIEAIRLLEPNGNSEALAIAWCGLSLGYGIAGKREFVQTAEKFAEVASATGSKWLVARSHLWLGLARWSKPQEAREQFLKCLRVAEEIGDVYFVAAGYLRLGHLASHQNEYSEAKRCAEQALPYFEQVGQPWSIYQTENLLGDASLNLNDYSAAKQHFQRALKAYKVYAQVDELLLFVTRTAELLTAQSPTARAVELVSLIINHPHNVHNVAGIFGQAEKLRAVLEAHLPQTIYTKAWEDGKTLSLEVVIEELLAHTVQA